MTGTWGVQKKKNKKIKTNILSVDVPEQNVETLNSPIYDLQCNNKKMTLEALLYIKKLTIKLKTKWRYRKFCLFVSLR